MKVVVLADTHTRGFSRALPMGAWPYVETADHILHAGDVVDPALLVELQAFARSRSSWGTATRST